MFINVLHNLYWENVNEKSVLVDFCITVYYEKFVIGVFNNENE